MLYILTFTAGIAVAAVLMWYFVGMTTRHARSPKARLEMTTAYVYAALIRAGRDPQECQYEAIMLAQCLNRRIDLESSKEAGK
jgi:hypothetical protein